MSETSSPRRKRTAVLVVHGIGSQRALETVRGIVRAVWFDHDDKSKDRKRVWTHPEPSGVDIDLSVMTTNDISDKAKRSADFHELYWAHLMSETRGVAVLLWLFELGRKGPRFQPGLKMNGLWWGGAIFLALFNLSIVLLVLRAIAWLAELPNEPASMLVVPILMLLVAVAGIAVASILGGAVRLAIWTTAVVFIAAGVVAVCWFFFRPSWATLQLFSNVLLPLGVALLVTFILMGKWGLWAFVLASLLSIAFFAIYLYAAATGWLPTTTFAESLANGYLPWSLKSQWSVVAAAMIIAVYFAVNASFLQPYLGDAARYFRNSPANVAVRREIRRSAVETLQALHQSGAYDRIIVVAHSLGSVVAYDMLRAYFGRIHRDLPNPQFFEPEFTDVDEAENPGAPNRDLRAKGRTIIGRMLDAAAETAKTQPRRDGAKDDSEAGVRTWLVTDFVTVGAALTHAHYLMCQGATLEKLAKRFDERTEEREYPMCPPRKLNGDGALAFTHWQTRARNFHHGGLFGMTRWTNLYFPVEQLFWGDAIGGRVGMLRPVDKSKPGDKGLTLFGSNVLDVAVWTNPHRKAGFFTHTLYWDVECDGGRKAPHIQALCTAIDLEDTGVANDPQNFNAIKGVEA